MGNDICILVSGQIRGSIKDLDSIAKFARKHAATVVISIWTKIGIKDAGAFRLPQRTRLLGSVYAEALPHDIQLPQFWDEFPWMAEARDGLRRPVSVSDLQGVFGDIPMILDVEDDILDLSFKAEQWDFNSKRMYYKVWRANEIKRHLERQRGKLFDQIMRVRPDYHIYDWFDIRSYDVENTVYLPWINTVGAADEVALMSSAGSDSYAQTFVDCASEPARPWEGCHQELGNRLRNDGFAIVPTSMGYFMTDGAIQQAFHDGLERGLKQEYPNNEYIQEHQPVVHLCRAGERWAAGKNEEAFALFDSQPDLRHPFHRASFARLMVRYFKNRAEINRAFFMALLSIHSMDQEWLRVIDRPYFDIVLNTLRDSPELMNQCASEAGLTEFCETMVKSLADADMQSVIRHCVSLDEAVAAQKIFWGVLEKEPSFRTAIGWV